VVAAFGIAVIFETSEHSRHGVFSGDPARVTGMLRRLALTVLMPNTRTIQHDLTVEPLSASVVSSSGGETISRAAISPR